MNAAHGIIPDVEGCDKEKKEDAIDCESDSDSSDSSSERCDNPFLFWHTDFITQEEIIAHMEICSGTDTEPEVLKLICPHCQQTFETYDRIKNHIWIRIMR